MLGCLISGVSIVFMGFQTAYRKVKDSSGDFVDEKNPEIGLVDAVGDHDLEMAATFSIVLFTYIADRRRRVAWLCPGSMAWASSLRFQHSLRRFIESN